MKPRPRAAPPASARRVLRHVVGAEEAGRRLDHLLGEWLSRALGCAPSKAALRRALMAGAVRVDGRVLRRPGFELPEGARLVADLDLERLGDEDQRVPAFALDNVRVLYEDEWLIAVDKPPGLPLHATADPRRPHLVGAVLAYLARPRASGGEPYLGVHQRLDRDTSGVVLFTKDKAANAGLAEQFERHAVEKVYVALTRRSARLPPRTWTVEDTLARVGRGRMGRVPASAGGQSARTDLRLLEVLPARLWIEARPRTGRQHQIRVHLAEAGLPILGDAVYGGAEPGVPRPMLHATRLSLRHPVTQVALTIECPPPADFTTALESARPPSPRAPARGTHGLGQAAVNARRAAARTRRR